MKLHALLAAALVTLSSSALAYDTDDYGFPIERSSRSIARSYSSGSTFARPSRLFRSVAPRFARTAPARPATQFARVTPTRVIVSRPVITPPAPTVVAAQPAAAPAQVVSVRSTLSQQR